MAIKYNWTCTACGTTNAAGTDFCVSCKLPAVVSAADLASRTIQVSKTTTPVSMPLRIAAHVVPIVAGIAMLLFAPHGIGGSYLVTALLLILIGPNIAVAVLKRLHDP
jgi:hypothetical protein